MLLSTSQRNLKWNLRSQVPPADITPQGILGYGRCFGVRGQLLEFPQRKTAVGKLLPNYELFLSSPRNNHTDRPHDRRGWNALKHLRNLIHLQLDRTTTDRSCIDKHHQKPEKKKDTNKRIPIYFFAWVEDTLAHWQPTCGRQGGSTSPLAGCQSVLQKI